MGNPSFQSIPMPFRSPTKPIHFTKDAEVFSIFVHENDFLNDFKAKGCIAEFLTVLKTPISIYVFFVICHISMLSYDIFCILCHMSAMTYDI